MTRTYKIFIFITVALFQMVACADSIRINSTIIEGDFTVDPRVVCHQSGTDKMFGTKKFFVTEKLSCSFVIMSSKLGELYRLSTSGIKTSLDGKKIPFEKEFVVKIDKFSGFEIEFFTKGLKAIEFQLSGFKGKMSVTLLVEDTFGPAKKRPTRPRDD